MKTRVALWPRAMLAAVLLAGAASGHAALFEDDEARRAILDLRQRVEALRMHNESTVQRLSEDNAQLRRSLVELQQQIDTLKGELARMTGQHEQFSRTLGELQQRQTDADSKTKAGEPSQVSLDGRDFSADPKEKTEFEAALGVFRAGQFAQSQTAFADFVRRYPRSGYSPSALFWLGNAQYATRNYSEAIANFRSMLSSAPDHSRAAEAVLSIANCQVELKDTRAARRTLEDLIKAYPQSEAAQAARERLTRLR